MALRQIALELGVEVDQGDIDKTTATLDKLKKAAIAVGAVFATGALKAGFDKVIDLASAAAERTNKFAAVFVEATDMVQAQIDDTSRRTGIANAQLQEFAANIGAIVKPSLGSAEAAGKLGAGVAELALDIASFNDVEPSDALVALRSGLIGSAEPLQRFGVDVRVAALQAEALRMGITKSIDAMTEGERVQVRFSAITRQLGAQGALGDATKTAESLSNATRALNSQFQALGEIIGGFFLEDARKTTIRIRDIVMGINRWILANREFIQLRVNDVLQVINNTIRGIELTVMLLIRGWNMLSDAVGSTTSNILLGVGALLTLVAILGAPIVAVLALGAAIGLIIDDIVTFVDGGESLFGLLVQKLQEFLGQFPAVEEAFNSLVSFVTGLWDSLFGDINSGFTEFFSNIFTKAVELWNGIVAEWGPIITDFFQTAITKIQEFTVIGIAKAKELFAQLSEFVAKALKDIFGGTLGRIIIDFLGAKAGAVVGEFMGKLVGRLAGQIAGKGIIGKALSSKAGQALFGLAGKGAGALIGGLKADDLALEVQKFINSPTSSAPSVAAAGGGNTTVVSPKTEVNVDVSGASMSASSPEEVGSVVAQKVSEVMDRINRQIQDDVAVAGAGG